MNLNLKVSSFMLAAFFGCSLQAATVTVSPWTPLFQGIDSASATIDGPNASVASAVRIDLTAPGVSFFSTARSGPLETIAQTTSQFLVSSGTAVAINANFFAPCCTLANEPKNLTGLAVSNGTVVSAPTSAPGSSNVALLVSAANAASIQTTTTNMDLSNVFNAVAGSALIVQNGQNIGAQSPTQGDPRNPNPRTNAGVSQDGQYLYLAAIDGRQAGYSAGTNMTETASIMLGLGAYTAMNLDGGGSTALVRADGSGGSVVLNRPSGGRERFNGNNFGVFASPLPIPEPMTFLLIALVLPGAAMLRRTR